MISKITGKLRSNWIVVLPIASAAASFILSFWLKIILTPEAYGDFATAFFTVNVLLGLGVVGYDQVIIRLSKLTERGLEIDKWIVMIGVLILLLTPGLSFVFLSAFGVVSEFSLGYLFMSWMAACIAVLAILFNLQGRLLESYFFLGSWKVVLLLTVSVLYLVQLAMDEFELLILFSLAGTFVWLLVFRKRIFYLVKGQLDAKSVYLLYFSSVISLVSYQAFEGLDRFLLLSTFDKVLFGDYFFVFNFLLAPTSIFVSYYTVKRLKIYKARFSYVLMFRDYVNVSVFSVLSGLCLLGVIYSIVVFGVVSFSSLDFSSVLIVLCLCVVRNGYLVLSAAYKVVASKSTLLFVAILFGMLSILVCSFSSRFEISFQLNELILVVLGLWLLRILLYFYVILNDSNKILKLT
ncbi:hypothetical protein ACNTOD_002836 [Vibrio navarrensis]